MAEKGEIGLPTSLVCVARDRRDMARITVRMYATLRDASGESERQLDADSLDQVLDILADTYGGKMREVLQKLSGSDGLVVLLNGKNVAPGALDRVSLRDGDEVAIFPPVSGG